MTLSVTPRVAGPFNCNGVIDDFDFDFKVFTTADVRVVRMSAAGVETVLVLDSDYSIALNADQQNNPGGTVTTSSVYASGTITVDGALAYSQPTELTNLGGFFPKVIERTFDRIVILIQQLKKLTDRSIKFPVSDADGPASLPTAANRAGKFLVFDGSGQPAVASGTGSDAALRTDLASTASGSRLIAWFRTSGVATTLYKWLGWQTVSVFEFMTAAEIDDVQSRAATIDMTTPIKNMIAAYPTGKIRLRFPRGRYLLVVGGINVPVSRMSPICDGPDATEFLCNPTTAGVTFFKFEDTSGAAITNNSFTGFGISTTDSTYKKIGINIVDASAFLLDDFRFNGTWQGNGGSWPVGCNVTGNGSVAVAINGRELGVISHYAIVADRPFYVGKINSPHTAGNIGIDHHVFRDGITYANDDYCHVTVETGVNWTQSGFDGYQSAVGGKKFLEWIDTTSTAQSTGLYIRNLRREGAPSSYVFDYAIDIQHNSGLQGFEMTGGYNGVQQGVNIRKVHNTYIEGWNYTVAGGIALNADASCHVIEGDGVFTQQTSTVVLAGQTLAFGVPPYPNGGALPSSFRYTPSTNAAFGTLDQFNIGVNVAGTVRGTAITATAQVNHKSYTVGTLPSAATSGGEVYVSNEAGGATLAFSDGTNWRRHADRVIVS